VHVRARRSRPRRGGGPRRCAPAGRTAASPAGPRRGDGTDPPRPGAREPAWPAPNQRSCSPTARAPEASAAAAVRPRGATADAVHVPSTPREGAVRLGPWAARLAAGGRPGRGAGPSSHSPAIPAPESKGEPHDSARWLEPSPTSGPGRQVLADDRVRSSSPKHGRRRTVRTSRTAPGDRGSAEPKRRKPAATKAAAESSSPATARASRRRRSAPLMARPGRGGLPLRRLPVREVRQVEGSARRKGGRQAGRDRLGEDGRRLVLAVEGTSTSPPISHGRAGRQHVKQMIAEEPPTSSSCLDENHVPAEVGLDRRPTSSSRRLRDRPGVPARRRHRPRRAGRS